MIEVESLLEKTKRQLYLQPDVNLVGIVTHPIADVDKPNFRLAEGAEVILTPTRSIWDPEKLNDFMKRVTVVGQQPDFYFPFWAMRGTLHLGRLIFNEELFKEENPAGEQKVIARRIFVRPYPDIATAEAALVYELEQANRLSAPRESSEVKKYQLPRSLRR